MSTQPSTAACIAAGHSAQAWLAELAERADRPARIEDVCPMHQRDLAVGGNHVWAEPVAAAEPLVGRSGTVGELVRIATRASEASLVSIGIRETGDRERGELHLIVPTRW